MSWNFMTLYLPVSGESQERFAPADQDHEPGDDKLEALSREHGEALYLWIDNHSDMCKVAYWRDGELVRNLAYYDEGWTELEGEPMAWEDKLFNDPEALEQVLEDEPEQREVYTAIQSTRRLQEGSMFPYPDVEGIAGLVAQELKVRLFET